MIQIKKPSNIFYYLQFAHETHIAENLTSTVIPLKIQQAVFDFDWKWYESTTYSHQVGLLYLDN